MNPVKSNKLSDISFYICMNPVKSNKLSNISFYICMNPVKSNKLGEDKEEFSESASVAGARSSYGGASMGQSRKGSMFDVGLESGRSPIPEEEGSLQDHQDCKLSNTITEVPLPRCGILLQ